jgi:hypothetical protein
MMLQRTLLIAVVFFISCGDKKSVPQGILKPEKMQTVLWDMLRADALTFNFMNRDTSKKPEAENVKLQQLIFAEQKITKEEFYKSFDYYKEHPNLMQPILDSMIDKATREKYKTTQVSAPKQDSAKIPQ